MMGKNSIIDISEHNMTHLDTDSYSSIYWQYNFQIQVILYKQGTIYGIAKLISFDFIFKLHILQHKLRKKTC